MGINNGKYRQYPQLYRLLSIQCNVLPILLKELEVLAEPNDRRAWCQLEAGLLRLMALYQRLPSSQILANKMPPALDHIIKYFQMWRLPLFRPPGYTSVDVLRLMQAHMLNIEQDILERHSSAIELQMAPNLCTDILDELASWPIDKASLPKTRCALDNELKRSRTWRSRIPSALGGMQGSSERMQVISNVVRIKWGPFLNRYGHWQQFAEWVENRIADLDEAAFRLFVERVKSVPKPCRMNSINAFIAALEWILQTTKGR
jgi:hypothetical protein